MSRYARKRDANEKQIIQALREVGAFVEQLSGTGTPDLLVAHRGRLYLIEVKDTRTESTGKGWKRSTSQWPELTPAQVRWWSAWSREDGCRPVVVHSAEEALEALGVAR